MTKFFYVPIMNYVKRIIQRLLIISLQALSWWDFLVYSLAYHSIRRICERNPGNAYLLLLHTNEWLIDHPINDEMKMFTEAFFKASRILESEPTNI